MNLPEQVAQDVKMLVEYVERQQKDAGAYGPEILDDMLISPDAFAEALFRLRKIELPDESDGAKKAREMGILWLEDEIPKFAAKVAPVFKQLNWTWWTSPMPPDAAAVEAALLELMVHIRKGSFDASTGGLRIELDEQQKHSAIARISMEIDTTKFISKEGT